MKQMGPPCWLRGPQALLLIAFMLPCFCRAATGQAPTSRPATQELLPVDATIEVNAFRYEGNTRVSSKELDAAVAGILKKGKLTIEDLEAAREALTLVYVNKGYISSGAILPDQPIADGVVTFQIVEGKITEINLRGQKRLRSAFLRGRIWPNEKAALNIVHLKNNLEILRENPNIKTINAELKPGPLPGQSILDVVVAENSPYHLGLSFNNRRPASIGEDRFELLASDTNVTGNSDTFAVRWGFTRGDLDQLEFNDLRDITLDYALPFTSADTTLLLNFENTDSLVIETPFEELDIQSRTETYGIGIRQPLYREPGSELAVFLTPAYRHNTTVLGGERFSFTPGTTNGESNVTAIRFGPEYLRRTQDYALAARSTFTVGVDALNATEHGDDIPDGQYFAWLGQAQYIRRMFKSDNQLVLRFLSQLSSSPLLPIEQFTIGGVDTVRGYRENQIARDNAVVASAELRIPLLRKGGRSILDLAPFVDAGYGWNHRIEGFSVPEDELMSSAGIGLLFNPNRRFSAEIYWGYPFKDFDNPHDSLQDAGFHFNLVVWAL